MCTTLYFETLNDGTHSSNTLNSVQEDVSYDKV